MGGVVRPPQQHAERLREGTATECCLCLHSSIRGLPRPDLLDPRCGRSGLNERSDTDTMATHLGDPSRRGSRSASTDRYTLQGIRVAGCGGLSVLWIAVRWSMVDGDDVRARLLPSTRDDT